jgi:hypothetical protein
MSLDLSTIALREPAVLIRDPAGTPAYFWTKGSVTLKPEVEYFDVAASAHASPEKRIKSLYWSLETELVGEWESLSVLFPLLSSSLGASVLGTTDVAWRLQGLISGNQWDFPRGGIIQRPLLRASVGQTLLGPIRLAFCCDSDKDPGESGAFYTYTAAQTVPDFASFAPANILTLAPAITYGSLMSAAHSESGVEVEFGWSTQPVLDNGLIRDWTVSGQDFTARLKPYALSFADIITACGYNQAMGSRLSTQTLIAAYTGFYAALRGATCEQAEFRFSGSEDFINGLVFRASQTYASNVQVAPGYVGTEAPA